MENKKPLGTFSCSCGMIYSRSGEDKTEEDKLKIGRVIAYGEVWENKLIELVEIEKLGLRATARELQVDPNTVKRYVTKLNLTPSWTKSKSAIQVKKTVEVNLEEIALQKKDIWLRLQRENPGLSKTEIRKLAPDVYAWLYRYNKKWLNENSPKLQKPKASLNRIDWNARDKEILIRVKAAVEQLLKKEKPVRITVGKVGSTIGLKALLERHLDKLSHTSAYLESATETVEDFQIRRIEWAIALLEDRGEEVKEWKILRLAALRKDLSDKVRMTLENELGKI